MIDVKDLRVGNYVLTTLCDGKTKEVNKITRLLFDGKNQIIEAGNGWFTNEYIPLTKEWLIKLRFQRISIDLWSNGIITVHYNKKCSMLIMENIELPYVHNLQNMQYILTGKELEL